MPIGGNIAGGGSSSSWSVIYEVDFTGEDYTFTGNDDTEEIAGKTWTAKSMTGGGGETYVEDLKLVSGSGLQFTFVVGNDESYFTGGGYHTCPRIEILVSDLVSGLDNSDTIAFQILASSDGLDDNWQFYGLHMSDGTTGNGWIENVTVFNDRIDESWPSPYIGSDIQIGTGGRYFESLGSGVGEPGFRELIWHVGTCGFISGVNQSSALIDPFAGSLNVYAVVSTATSTNPEEGPALDITKASGTIGLHAYYNSEFGSTVTSAFVATISKLRVLRRSS
jgi:hypothetical protein